MSKTSNTRCAELVARFSVRAICPIVSIGPTNMVVYSKNEMNVPAESVVGFPAAPSKRGKANAHTATVVTCTASIRLGQNAVQ